MSDKQSKVPPPDEGKPLDIDMARRRRLLKGLIAGLPAVVTLQSGAALALSSANRCFMEAPLPAPSPNRCTDNSTANAGPPHGDLTVIKGKYKMLPEATFCNGGACDVSGDTDTFDLCVVYADGQGVVDTNLLTNYGATVMNGPPNGTHYAISHSCWHSIKFQ